MTCASPSIRSMQDGLARTLLAAFEADLARNCAAAIAAVQRDNPADYLRIALRLLPKERPPEKAGLDPSLPPGRRYSSRRRALTAQRLRELLDYDPETGIFRWRKARSTMAAGRRAGCQNDKYRTICIDRVHHLAHRLAWLYVHGEHPPQEIDHVNGDSSDCRIANLRSCTPRQNSRNRRGRGAGGLKGVTQPTQGRWRAMIYLDGKNTHLGFFGTKEEAAAAYDAVARRHFGEFARLNDLGDGAGG
jgi:hypothetical protein